MALRVPRAWLWPALAVLVVTPALAGHASTIDPRWALIPLDVVHVAGMSVWIGGIAFLLLALPAATRAVDPPERTKLLAGALVRFSPYALAAVIALAVTGTVQAVLHLESFGDLLDTAFGRAVLIKIVLFLLLVGAGVWHRRRSIPRLKALAEEGESPGAEGGLVRNVLRVEIATLVAVIGVTAALVSYPPPTSLASGPFSDSRDIGALRMELTVDPARVGRNQIHLYLLDGKDGSQFDGTEELRLTATLPAKKIGPLELRAREAGPGHYVADGADLAPAGDWDLGVYVRVSEFDAYEEKVKVPVE